MPSQARTSIAPDARSDLKSAGFPSTEMNSETRGTGQDGHRSVHSGGRLRAPVLRRYLVIDEGRGLVAQRAEVLPVKVDRIRPVAGLVVPGSGLVEGSIGNLR